MLWGAALRVKATVTESIDGNLHELQAEQEAMLAEARRLQPLVGAEAGDARPPWRVLSEQYQVRGRRGKLQMGTRAHRAPQRLGWRAGRARAMGCALALSRRARRAAERRGAHVRIHSSPPHFFR